jgi:DNA repair protein RecO (recombination protein O)
MMTSSAVRVALQPSYVLHARPYRDNSALLEVFTAEQGRISLVARGARRRTRGGSSGALLQPFTPLLLSFSGRTDLKNLGATESAGPPQVLRGERLFSGLYLNELLVRLLHRHDPHPQLFAAYGATLEALAGSEPLDDILRQFEFTLLGELGYGFSLDIDGLSGEAVLPDHWYHYHPDWGLVARGAGADAAQPAFAGAELLAMAACGFGGQARGAAKRLLRQVLAVHLGEAPLRSRELFRTRSAGERAATASGDQA